MDTLKPASYYLELLQQAQERNDFSALGEVDSEATIAYGYLTSLNGKLEAKKALFIENYTKENEGKHTIAFLDRQWDITPEGQAMIKGKANVKVFEAILRNVKNKIIQISIEKRAHESNKIT